MLASSDPRCPLAAKRHDERASSQSSTARHAPSAIPAQFDDASARSAQLSLLGLDVDPVQPRQVLAEDLALGLLGELRVAALLDDVPRELEVPELLQRPLRVPDRRLAAVDDLVLPAPPHHLPERLGEDPRLASDEVHRRRDRGVEVGVAHDLPQDLVEPWEPDVEDHEVDVGEVGRRAVHVECARVLDRLRPERHALVDADQVDAELLRALEGGVGDARVVHAPRERLPVVVAHVVELERLGAVILDLAGHEVERLLALQRVHRAPEHRAVRMLLRHLRALLPRRQPVVEEVGERERLGGDHVRVGALDDHLVDLVDAPLAEELVAREHLLPFAREELVEGVEMLVEQLAGRPERVGLVEVEHVADAVEHERVDLALAGAALVGAALDRGHQAALLPARYGSSSPSGIVSFSRADSESRSMVQTGSHTTCTSTVSTPSTDFSASGIVLDIDATNGHQPVVSTRSTATCDPATRTSSTTPMSTIEMPRSAQQGSYTSRSASMRAERSVMRSSRARWRCETRCSAWRAPGRRAAHATREVPSPCRGRSLRAPRPSRQMCDPRPTPRRCPRAARRRTGSRRPGAR